MSLQGPGMTSFLLARLISLKREERIFILRSFDKSARRRSGRHSIAVRIERIRSDPS